MEQYIANTGAEVRYGGNRAYYSPDEDYIQMPNREQFLSREGFCSTLFHESGHRTGHPSRLNRDMGGRFGKQAYAVEKLVATIHEAFQCVKHGSTAKPREDHAQYLKNWLQVLRGDNKAILTAASAAQKAFSYLDSLQPAPAASRPTVQASVASAPAQTHVAAPT